MKRLVKKLYITRHCSTEDTEAKRYSGNDTPLSKKGVVEARKLANILTKVGIEEIYSSPHKRALQTAEIVQETFQCPLKIINNLGEVNHGVWTGYTTDEVRDKWKKVFDMRGMYPKTIAPPGGESIERLQERTLEALEVITGLECQGNILFVTHGGNIHTLWMYLLNADLNDFWSFTKENQIGCGDVYLLSDAQKVFSEKANVSLKRIFE